MYQDPTQVAADSYGAAGATTPTTASAQQKLAAALNAVKTGNSVIPQGTMAGNQYVPPSSLAYASGALQQIAPALGQWYKRQQMGPVTPQATPITDPNAGMTSTPIMPADPTMPQQ